MFFSWVDFLSSHLGLSVQFFFDSVCPRSDLVHSIGAALHVVSMFVRVFVQVWDEGALATVGCFGGKFVGLRVLFGSSGAVRVRVHAGFGLERRQLFTS